MKTASLCGVVVENGGVNLWLLNAGAGVDDAGGKIGRGRAPSVMRAEAASVTHLLPLTERPERADKNTKKRIETLIYLRCG